MCALVIAGAADAASAEARTPSPAGAGAEDREAQRTETYREAMKAAGAGHWAEAKERLRAVLMIRSSPKVLFSLAQAEEQLGQLASAQVDYARSLEAGAMEGKGDVVQAAELAQRALSPRVPHVRVVLAGLERERLGASGASATLDDLFVTVGAAVAVDPGDHRVVVSAPGKRVATLSVRVNEGQQLDVPVSLETDQAPPPSAVPSPLPPAPAPAPVPVPAPPGPDVSPKTTANAGSPWRTAGLLTAGTGLIALGVGAVTGLESISKHNEAENACPGATCPTANGASLWHDAVVSGNVSTVAFVVGGVGLLGGVILWLAAPKAHSGGARLGLGPGSVQVRGAW